MSKFSLKVLGLAAIVAGGALAMTSGPASAVMLPAAGGQVVSSAGLVQEVAERPPRRRFSGRHPYWQHRHYRNRRPGFHFYFGGWWYAQPWWRTTPPPLLPEARGSAHISWCLNRYRSYNPATDMFFGFDGRYHRCRSPYRP
jgi:hypothetical protein